jgi:triosephosphate isomerase
MTQKIVAANWKMHGTKDSVRVLVADLQQALQANAPDCDVVIFAPYVFLPELQQTLTDSVIKFGAQNLSEYDQGAYTAEISATMLNEFGCDYVLVGHSERRQLFHESDEIIAKKFMQAQANDLIPMLCVGETLEEREAEQTMAVITRQLDAVLATAGISAFKNAVLAYEPVWAIGTGKTASPEQAQAVHANIREFLADYDKAIACELTLLYGGSVKANNAADLFAMPDIDGALVGGASLDAPQFIEIVEALH